jgi:hypothetical protein
VKYKVTTTPQLFPGAVLKINGFELSELTNAAAGALVGLVILSKNGAIIEIGVRRVYTYPLTLNIIATDDFHHAKCVSKSW